MTASPTLDIHFGDNLPVLQSLESESIDLIYIDPPFNTGRVQSRRRLKTREDESGERIGFYGKRYRQELVERQAYDDRFDDYLAFLFPRLQEAFRLLKPDGSFFVHLDCREVHYCTVALDGIFGRDCFMNEIIWAYDYGARTRKRWSAKHDNLLWYVKNPKRYTFQYDQIDRIPYMAPRLVRPEKVAQGKTPTDVWWNTIVSPTGKEKTGYPTQKPRAIIDRIVRVHTRPGDRLLDCFAGSGTLGESAFVHGRSAVLVDHHQQALEVMQRRLAFANPRWHGWPLAPIPAPETQKKRVSKRSGVESPVSPKPSLNGSAAEPSKNSAPQSSTKTASASGESHAAVVPGSSAKPNRVRPRKNKATSQPAPALHTAADAASPSSGAARP